MLGIAAIALAIGIVFFMKYAREPEIPTEGTLVKNFECVKDELMEWV